MRAFPVSRRDAGEASPHFLVLVEGVTEKHALDFSKAATDFTLTRRGQEVLTLLCQGLPNKGIADSLYISEYTVKGHIKKIMVKMHVSSRSEIIASLLRTLLWLIQVQTFACICTL